MSLDMLLLHKISAHLSGLPQYSSINPTAAFVQYLRYNISGTVIFLSNAPNSVL